MEQNILKNSVFTNETVFCETVEQSIDTDFSLPDYLSDALKVLKCIAKPRIALKTVTDKTVTVDGAVQITVIYCDDAGKIHSFCHMYPFEKVKDTGVDLESAAVEVSAKCEYINCRAVTARKIDIHGALGIKIVAKRKKQCEIICDMQDKNIEVLRGSVPATSPTGYAEKYLIIEEETEIGTEESGEQILRYDADACVKECKIINGKIIAKGEMRLKVKYLSCGNVKLFKTDIPFSQMLELETVGDDCECTAKVKIAFLEARAKCDSAGKFNVISVNAKLLICAESFCNNDIAVLYDAYSTKNDFDITKSSVSVTKLVKKINETFNLKKSLSFESGDISAVLDNWCDIKVNETLFTEKALLIKGTATASFITEDSGEIANYYEKPIEFEYKYPIENSTKDLECQSEIVLSSISYTIVSANSVELQVEMNVSADLYAKSSVPIVTEISVLEGERKGNDTAMIVYFASSGEKLWDIAKKYLASSEDIKTLNSIDFDVFSADTAILIPTK